MDLVFYVLIPAFLAAHLYDVLAYYPGEVLRDPLMLLRIWENISSFGGIAGGLFGIWLFFRRRGKELAAETRWEYLDAVAYVFPFAWIVGRLACTVAHDHPGTVTTFPLAVSLKTAEARAYIASVYQAAGRLDELPSPARLAGMGFHDLGFYEFLYTLFVIAPAFLLLDRAPRRTGFYPIAFLLLYVPARFALDFLRVSDARYLGLTPGQYAGIAAMALAVFALRFARLKG